MLEFLRGKTGKIIDFLIITQTDRYPLSRAQALFLDMDSSFAILLRIKLRRTRATKDK